MQVKLLRAAKPLPANFLQRGGVSNKRKVKQKAYVAKDGRIKLKAVS